jgi:hypothetical protein
MCRVSRRFYRLLLRFHVVSARGIDFGRFAESEWTSKDDAPRSISIKTVVRQLPGPHLDARLAAAIASVAFEYRYPFHS